MVNISMMNQLNLQTSLESIQTIPFRYFTKFVQLIDQTKLLKFIDFYGEQYAWKVRCK